MATATTSLLPDNSTDTNFRAWGSWISTELAAMGWVQTADTGQINWTTVTHPTVANTAQGYEIWRMADTLQATAPVVIKLEYGGGAAAADPSVWITAGTASNGAGTLTGAATTRQQLQCGFTSTSFALPCYISGATNRLQLAMFTNGLAIAGSGAAGFMVALERTHDNTGADTNTAVTFAGCNDNSGWKTVQQTLPTTGGGGAPAMETNTISFATSNTSGTYGTSTGVGPIFPFLGQYLNPLVGLLTAILPDVSCLATATLAPYGTNHNYLVIGGSSPGSASNAFMTPSVPGKTASTFFMLYE
jgi:hypothetical protein